MHGESLLEVPGGSRAIGTLPTASVVASSGDVCVDAALVIELATPHAPRSMFVPMLCAASMAEQLALSDYKTPAARRATRS